MARSVKVRNNLIHRIVRGNRMNKVYVCYDSKHDYYYCVRHYVDGILINRNTFYTKDESLAIRIADSIKYL